MLKRAKCYAFVAILVVSMSSVGSGAELDHARQWAQWRGPQGVGVAPHADPPVEWDENKNIKWKVEIPGQGHASPIV